MSVLAWLAVGVVAGVLASRAIDKTGSGVIVDIIIGAFGALVGGFAFKVLGHPTPDGVDINGTFWAFVGAVAILLAYHPLSSGRLR